jgi:Uma2 family endonuclease
MSTLAARRRRFSVDDYERMIAAGVFRDDDRCELIDGEVVEMSPIGPDHAGRVNRLNRLLVLRLGSRATVAVQNPVRLPPLSMPQPDLAVLRPRDDDYTRSHPAPDEVLWVIEVSDTTVARDRAKLRLYADAGVPEVWIVNLPEARIEVYRDPAGGAYADTCSVRSGERQAPSAFPDAELDVAEILG